MSTNTFAWPHEAKCAAMVTFNLDAGLFLPARHPGAKLAGTGVGNVVNTSYALRTRRLLDVIEARGIRATFFVPGSVAKERAPLVAEIASRGHEIAVRGWAAENLALLPLSEQKTLLERSVAAVAEAAGAAPKGFRAPDGELTRETLKLARELGLTYSSSLCDDDRPYRLNLGGESIIEIPAHWAMSDLPYFVFNFWPPVPFGQDRIATFRKVLLNWQWEYDAFYDEGLCWVLQLDPYSAGESGHAFVVERILDHIIDKGGTWFVTGSEMTAFCQSRDDLPLR